MAQSGRVRIRVTDATGAVIGERPEASLLGNDAKPILTAHANEVGEIVLTGLPIGDSRITVTWPGFKNSSRIVTIRNADELKIDATLEIGTVGTYIELEPDRGVEPARIEPPREDLNSIPPPKMIEMPSSIPGDPPSKIPSPKRNRKRWWIFRKRP